MTKSDGWEVKARLRVSGGRSSGARGWRSLKMLGLGGGCLLTLLSYLSPSFRAHLVQPILAQFWTAPPKGQSFQNFCAPFGGHESFRLDDDSGAELNSGTCISVAITATNRLVRLESGEAIFSVARDPSRPFVVETGPVSIEALGTQFDVFRKELSTRVAVSEGAVRVTSNGTMPPANAQPLTILEQIDVPDDVAQSRVRKQITTRDFERMTAWVRGDIQLESLPLKDAFGEFARYQHIQVDFRDPHIADVRFGGAFRTRDLDSFLGVLGFKCIHGEYDKAAQRITLSSEPGKIVGGDCQ